jgi:hypothetical protein
MKMDETQFSEQLRKLQEPSGPNRTWESPVFAMQDYESMTDSQLSKVVLEMLKFTGPGSYWLRQDLFDLIDCLDGRISISEDLSLEKYLHLIASLICLAQFEGRIDFHCIEPARLAKHLERIIGPIPFNVPSMETEPSLQIATFLAYPLLEGIIRRKLSKFITPSGIVLRDFQVIGRKEPYEEGKRISNLYHELQLLEKETQNSSLKAMLADVNRVQPLFPDIHKYRNMLLHGELTACWHSITLLLLAYIILLER